MIETILLCAGQSSRMGEDKALLTFEDKPIIYYLLKKLFLVSDKVNLVLGSNFDNVSNALKNFSDIPLNKINFIYNENHLLGGMFSSFLKGFGAVKENSKVFLQMIDQPFVKLSTYKILLENLGNHIICQPRFTISDIKSKKGHPILFAEKYLQELEKCKAKAQTVRDVIVPFYDDNNIIDVDDEGIIHNLNTKEIFINTLKKFEERLKNYDN